MMNMRNAIRHKIQYCGMWCQDVAGVIRARA